jgi:hypothetical protein
LPDELVLSDGVVEVRVAHAHGPRVTAFQRVGGPNVFGDAPGATRETPHGLWRAYGGHRLWAAPESFPETYTLDDAPPDIEAGPARARIRRTPDARTTFAIEIEVDLAGNGDVRVTHRIRNDGQREATVAAWGLTIVQPGGVALIPNAAWRAQPEALQPARPYAVWHYTAMDDPRLRWGAHTIGIRCDPARPAPLKIGAGNEHGWFAYVRERTAFVVRSAYVPGAAYPDLGCSNEVYTEGAFCEVETLGPLARLAPGESTEHRETWSLLEDVDDADGAALIERVGAASAP